jgi:hypothetical protein
VTGTGEQLHQLEQEFGLPAREILEVINRRNRCKIAVRGAIAEEYLIRTLRDWKSTGAIVYFEDFDIDGQPDCRVDDVAGRSFTVECKNVEKLKPPKKPPKRPAKTPKAITIDFQRTRDPKGVAGARYYLPSEFDVVAACLWNRTGKWEFLFAATKDLPRHKKYPDRLSNRLPVDPGAKLPDGSPIWTDDLPALLRRL